MLDGQTQPNLTIILGWAREISIIGFLLGFSWKARGMWDSGSQFLNDVKRHMTTMEVFALDMKDNHLRHIQESLEKIAEKSPIHPGEVTVTVKTGKKENPDDEKTGVIDEFSR